MFTKAVGQKTFHLAKKGMNIEGEEEMDWEVICEGQDGFLFPFVSPSFISMRIAQNNNLLVLSV